MSKSEDSAPLEVQLIHMTVDPETGARYIRLTNKEVVQTLSINEDILGTQRLNESVNIDIDVEGNVIGIEIY